MWKNILAIIILGIVAFALLPFSRPIVNQAPTATEQTSPMTATYPTEFDQLMQGQEGEGKRVVLPEFVISAITKNPDTNVSMCLSAADTRQYSIKSSTMKPNEYELYSDTGTMISTCSVDADGNVTPAICAGAQSCTLIFSPDGTGTETL